MYYFAYGSNMSLPRLQARLSFVEKVTTCQLKNHRLTFNMLSKDGSGKCNIVSCEQGSFVLGVLFKIAPDERDKLDSFEGFGSCYTRREVELHLPNNDTRRAFTYFALRTEESVKPYGWYKHHVFHGAAEACLPESYIQSIKSVQDIKDEDISRHQREMSIYSKIAKA
ncbi:Uncharacterized protein involved in cation transport [Alteromonadaceae bacterium Bs31]|nr:Uncharacterized protein involved in cation transport [Alteromonadaceae bacterium Bs31]